MGKFWKYFFALLGIDVLTGNSIFDGRKKGRIGCAWVWLFGIIFFPLWLIFKLILWPFKLLFSRK